jgi:hypothetical protein
MLSSVVSLIFALLMALFGVPPSARAVPAAMVAPQALNDSDLVVGGVSAGTDTLEVRRRLGKPRARTIDRWSYDGLLIFTAGGEVTQFHLTTRAWATARGVRVGDTVEQLESRYGESCYEGAHSYCRSLDDADERGINVTVQEGRVIEISVGKDFDLD